MDGTIVELDKTRTLRFSNSSLKRAEMLALKETGMGIAKLLKEQAVFYVIPLLMWTGLHKEDPSLTRQKAEELTEGKLSECGNAVAEALQAAGFLTDEGNATRA